MLTRSWDGDGWAVLFSEGKMANSSPLGLGAGPQGRPRARQIQPQGVCQEHHHRRGFAPFLSISCSLSCSPPAPPPTTPHHHPNKPQGERWKGSFPHFMDVDTKEQEGLKT